MLFTTEELTALEAADAAIDADFQLNQNDLIHSRELDRATHMDSLPFDKRAIAARQKAYREANREKVAARQKAYREANQEKVAAYQKAYREANREKVAAQKKGGE